MSSFFIVSLSQSLHVSGEISSARMIFPSEVFPNSIFLGNYKEKPYFDAVAGAEKPVDVEFDFNKEKK